jgi:hypothetical protein
MILVQREALSGAALALCTEPRRLEDMSKLTATFAAGLTAMVIGFAIAPAQAAPTPAGAGGLINATVPDAVEDVRWRGGWRGHRVVVVRPYRPYRHAFYGHGFYRPAYYGGGGCFWRPARTVWTPYGWRFRPARRICRW